MNQVYINSFPALKKRGVVVAVLLTLITCGIYGILWNIFLSNEIRKECSKSQDGILMFLVSLVTCGLVYLYWIYRMGNDLAQLSQRSNRTQMDSSEAILYLILALFGLSIISLAIMQSKANDLADE